MRGPPKKSVAVRTDESIARVSRACRAFYEALQRRKERHGAGPEVVWVPEFGPCNSWERALAKQLVAEVVTHEASMEAWFTPSMGQLGS